MSRLSCDSRVIATPAGNVLEITFRGIHEWSHGGEMDRYVEDKLTETRPAAVLFNLLDYEYVSGNDVTALFSASFDRDGKKGARIRPVCIVATGTTHRSLYSFFEDTQLLDAFAIEFASSEAPGLQHLKARLEKEAV